MTRRPVIDPKPNGIALLAVHQIFPGRLWDGIRQACACRKRGAGTPWQTHVIKSMVWCGTVRFTYLSLLARAADRAQVVFS